MPRSDQTLTAPCFPIPRLRRQGSPYLVRMSLPPGPSPAPELGEQQPSSDASSDIPMWLVLALVGVLIAAVGLTGYVLLDQRKDGSEAAGPSYPSTWDPRVVTF